MIYLLTNWISFTTISNMASSIFFLLNILCHLLCSFHCNLHWLCLKGKQIGVSCISSFWPVCLANNYAASKTAFKIFEIHKLSQGVRISPRRRVNLSFWINLIDRIMNYSAYCQHFISSCRHWNLHKFDFNIAELIGWVHVIQVHI